MFEPNGLVTLTTDFGASDGYVGAMKGVIYSTSLQLRAVDVAHEVQPQSVIHGAMTVAAACPRFPPGTVHVVVVDPGVGSPRAPIALVAGGHCFIGPDNGVLGEAAAALGGVEACHRIDRRFGPVSHTFHGRDIFAPAGAAVAAGLLVVSDLGPAHQARLVRLPEPREVSDGVLGEVLLCDHFGNCVTNLRAREGARAVVLPDGRRVPVVNTYADVAPGEGLALIGSSGWLEVSVRDGSGQRTYGLEPGATVLALI